MTFKAAGQALKDVTFHQAYSSDLQRALKTCQIILEENQKSSINASNIIQEKLLQERDMGNFEGMKLEEMYKLLDEHYQFKPDSGFVSIYKRKNRRKKIEGLAKYVVRLHSKLREK